MPPRAPEYAGLTDKNKTYRPPFAASKSSKADRWVITAWEPVHRCWGNARYPCLHSDPKFPDCPPGKTVRLRGGLWFYQGDDLKSGLKRLAKTWPAKP